MERHVLVAGSFVLLAACGEAVPEAKSRVIDDGSIARASVLSPSCGARATLIELPDHCAWPESARRSKVLEAKADVVVDVDEHDVARSARVLRGTSDDDLDAAVVACAMQGRYRAAWSGAGQTCPVTVRLARYASDLAPRQARLPGDCVRGVGFPFSMAAFGGVCGPDEAGLR